MNRILLVEDEPVNIQAVSGILKDHGYQVSVAISGAKALEVLTRVRPDLILLDVMMPGLDGFETCQLIKANADFREIPIIFLTAKTETDAIVRGFEVGAVDYVAKPFNGHELLARVRTHLSLDRLHRENRRLLLNVLPEPIAEKLKCQQGILAERYEDASVLFTDIVGFTPLSARLSPTELIELLNHIFSEFDELAAGFGLEKIKTIGDAYMVAGGLPEPHPEHLAAMASLSLEMHKVVHQAFDGLNLRVGLHVGSVIAGVIGRRKFIYDVWGETVNTASRLESHGAPDRVHVSQAVYQRLSHRFDFEARGITELKGKGPMETYFLLGEKS
ncbi:response regulator [bacterium]|nr:response regulator [bacterium]